MAGKHTILGGAVSNLPWEEKPKGSADILWRYSSNPIIPRHPFRTNEYLLSVDELLDFLKSHSTVF